MINVATVLTARLAALSHHVGAGCRLALPLLLVGSWGMAQVPTAHAGGTITGRVVYVGEIPQFDPIEVERDRAFCGDTVPNESTLIDRNTRGVAAAIVSLDGVSQEPPARAPDRKVLLENRACRFVPRVSAVLGETVLVISNTDPIMHNTHIRKKTRFGDNFVNVVQPNQAKVEKALPEAGYLDIRCDAHPFMHASIHVFAHPYFALTDSAGQFALPEVPPGTYTLRLWHETLGSQVQQITVPEKGTVSVKLEVGPGN